MNKVVLSRRSLSRVLQSLLTAELSRARGRSLGTPKEVVKHGDRWPEEKCIAEGDADSLDCDSLELLWLAAATNEMFNLFQSTRDTNLLTARTFGSWLDIIEAAWESGVHQITFSTSGSTGVPKRCVHDVNFLYVEIAFLGRLFADRRRVVSFVPAHHIYGFLFTAMLPDLLNLDVLSGKPMGSGELSRLWVSGDLLISVPEVWEWLDRSIPVWPKGICGVVSTAPCPPSVIRSLIEHGMSGMSEIYGSTETAGVAVRSWPQPCYLLMPQWRLIAEGTESVSLLHSFGRAFQSMDRMRILSENTFLLEGRRDEAVQVGGINVYLDRIANSLRSVPGVREVSVRLMRPEEGNRLKAFVVPESECDLSQLDTAVRAWAQTHPSAAEIPKMFTFGDTLPQNGLGKPCDW